MTEMNEQIKVEASKLRKEVAALELVNKVKLLVEETSLFHQHYDKHIKQARENKNILTTDN